MALEIKSIAKQVSAQSIESLALGGVCKELKGNPTTYPLSAYEGNGVCNSFSLDAFNFSNSPPGFFSSVSANQTRHPSEVVNAHRTCKLHNHGRQRDIVGKIDGNYPIYLNNQSGNVFGADLSMVYPMPPNSTNIHVFFWDAALPGDLVVFFSNCDDSLDQNNGARVICLDCV